MDIMGYDLIEGLGNFFDPKKRWYKLATAREKYFYKILAIMMFVALIHILVVTIAWFITRNIYNWMILIIFTNVLCGVVIQTYRKYLKAKYGT